MQNSCENGMCGCCAECVSDMPESSPRRPVVSTEGRLAALEAKVDGLQRGHAARMDRMGNIIDALEYKWAREHSLLSQTDPGPLIRLATPAESEAERAHQVLDGAQVPGTDEHGTDLSLDRRVHILANRASDLARTSVSREAFDRLVVQCDRLETDLRACIDDRERLRHDMRGTVEGLEARLRETERERDLALEQRDASLNARLRAQTAQRQAEHECAELRARLEATTARLNAGLRRTVEFAVGPGSKPLAQGVAP